jgi:hypothetical protein
MGSGADDDELGGLAVGRVGQRRRPLVRRAGRLESVHIVGATRQRLAVGDLALHVDAVCHVECVDGGDEQLPAVAQICHWDADRTGDAGDGLDAS